jgi:hypothetical protein
MQNARTCCQPKRLEPLLVEHEEIENWKAHGRGFLFEREAKNGTNSAPSVLRANKHATERWRQFAVTGQIVRVQSAHTEKFLLRISDARAAAYPCSYATEAWRRA